MVLRRGCSGISVGEADDEFLLATDAAAAHVTGAYFVGHRQVLVLETLCSF